MFRKKKNEKGFMDIFNEHLYDIEDYKKTNELCNKIKGSYQKKIEKDGLDIKIEKIRVQRKLGKFTSYTMNLYVSLFMIAISTLINGFIQAYMVSNKETNIKVAIIILTSFAFYGMILYLIRKSIDSDKDRAYVYNVCLKVLEDIESNTNKSEDKAIHEVAATKDAKRKVNRRVKKKVIYYY